MSRGACVPRVAPRMRGLTLTGPGPSIRQHLKVASFPAVIAMTIGTVLDMVAGFRLGGVSCGSSSTQT